MAGGDRLVGLIGVAGHYKRARRALSECGCIVNINIPQSIARSSAAWLVPLRIEVRESLPWRLGVL